MVFSYFVVHVFHVTMVLSLRRLSILPYPFDTTIQAHVNVNLYAIVCVRRTDARESRRKTVHCCMIVCFP